ncbi:MAG: DNA replication/repair protein RecF, partial [bacterium]|nr:DNA replication/repair protein RecF [bacterium]
MLKSIDLINFRSYKKIDLRFDDKTIIIYGPNAIGKTNLLESIFVASVGKPFHSKDVDLIRHGEEFFRIESIFSNIKVELSLQKKENLAKKNLKLAGAIKPLINLIGLNPVTLFEPNDMNLLHGPPHDRRRYLDIVLSQADPLYSLGLANYRHILRQRNKLLGLIKNSTNSQKLDDQLFIWDMQLVEPAAQIIGKRAKLIDKLNIIIGKYYQDIAGERAKINIEYLPSLQAKKEETLKTINQNTKKDKRAGFTTIGPHRDDFAISFNGYDVSRAASRGEIRTIVLALKMAEMDLIESYSGGKRPILLLDDVFSELDKTRRNYLLNTLKLQQTFITTTEDNNKIKQAQLIDLTKIKKN